jgi:outer membrane lipoprotein-sorting protein
MIRWRAARGSHSAILNFSRRPVFRFCMRKNSPTFLSAVLALFITGCFFRTHVVDQRQVNTANLMKANLQQLVTKINAEASKIQTMTATVEIATAVGGAKKGVVKEYQQIKGYIIAKQPDQLRMYGLLPVVRSRAFDMASNGKEFELYIPPLNRFVEGSNEDSPTPSTTNSLENLRPHIFFDSLLLHEIHPDEVTVFEQGLQTVQDSRNKKKTWQLPDYIIDVLRKNGDTWMIERKIEFDRVELKPIRQQIFNAQGEVMTEAVYRNFQDFNGISFPSIIEINRPKEEYSITITIEKLQLNTPLPQDEFALKKPEGATVQTLK